MPTQEAQIDWKALRARATDLPLSGQQGAQAQPAHCEMPPTEEEYQRMTPDQKWAAWRVHSPQQYRLLRRRRVLSWVAHLLAPESEKPAR